MKTTTKAEAGGIVQVGSRVTTSIRGSSEGATVVFIGDTKFAPGIWYGLRLDRAVGKNNGTVQGIRYFQSESRRGLFVKRGKIKPHVSLPRDRSSRLQSQRRGHTHRSKGSGATFGSSRKKLRVKFSKTADRPSWNSSTVPGRKMAKIHQNRLS